MRWNNIRTRLLILWGITLIVISVAIISISAFSSFQSAVSSARQQVLTSAFTVEREIRDQMLAGLEAARKLSQTLYIQVAPETKVKFTRSQVNAMIRQIIEHTPQIIGSGTMWEPNAFDNRDAEFAGLPMHDNTGRFMPYWFRNKNGIVVGEVLHDYEDSQWWNLPRNSLKESTTEPYWYKIGDENVLMMTFSIPVVHEGRFYGIATADILLNFIQKLVDNLHVFNGKATLAIISSGGKLLAANHHPEFWNTDVNEVYPQFAELLPWSRREGIVTTESEESLTIVSPIHFDGSDAAWYAAFNVPKAVIFSLPRKVLLQQILGGVICIFIGLAILSILIGQHTTPIRQAAAMAHKIREGDLSQRLNIKRKDEIGQLGKALDEMTAALQKRTVELAESRLNLAVTLDSIGDAVITTDIQGHVTRMNPVAETITGWGLTEAIGHPLSEVLDLIHFTSRESLGNHAQKVLSADKSIEIPNPTILRSKTGEEFLIADSGAPIRSESGETIGVVLVFRDVTEETAVQEQLRQRQKLDAIGELAGGVAHDFNNMLGGIMGSCELLRKRITDDEKAERYLSLIFEASKRSAELANKLLAFSRRQAPGSTPIDIHTVISDTVALLEKTIDKRIEISVEPAAEASMIVGDCSQLQSVFLNLGINASHAMPDGGTLSFKSSLTELSTAYCKSSIFDIVPGSYIEIEVRDSGSGIAPENLSKIFDPFFTTKEQGKGTGLGLAAAYGTVKQHKGAITVYSESGRGTRFHLLFPLTKSFNPAPQQRRSCTGQRRYAACR